MTEVFRIDYPKTESGKKAWNKVYGMNAIYAGKHWTKRRQDAQMWHLMTVGAMNRARCRKTPFDKPVVIRFLWNDRLDLSNHAYMAKLIEDGMTGRIIADDSRRYVRGIEHFFHDAPCIKVIVQEVGDDEESDS